MGIADGFNLWLGKILAELLITAIVFGVIGVVYFAILFAQQRQSDRRRKRRDADRQPKA